MGWKGKASQNSWPGLLFDSKGGKLFLNFGAHDGRGGGVGDGPPANQLISVPRDNPNGPEKKRKYRARVKKENYCHPYKSDIH